MPRKNKHAIELLPPATLTEADFRRMVNQAVEQKVAEAMSGSDAIFRPFFDPRDISDAISRKQTVAEQNKWGHYFEKWGCLVCGTKDAAHRAVGMCENCRHRVFLRLQTILRKHAPPTDQALPTFMDTVKLAREALGPVLKALPPGSTARRRTK